MSFATTKTVGANEPTLEPLEPRLLLSTTPVLAELLSSASILDIGPEGTIEVDGFLQQADDSAVYRFTTKALGKLYLEMSAADGGIDPYLELYDSNLRRVRRNDNASSGTLDSRVRIAIRAGQTYYALASASGGTSGEFTLSVTSDAVDDCGNSTEEARHLWVTRSGSRWTLGTINYSGDEDFTEFVATRTGQARVELDSYGRRRDVSGGLAVYDADGALLTFDANADGGAAYVEFDVVEGERYFLRAVGEDDTTGRYRLRIYPTLDHEFVQADALELPSVGSVDASGTLGAGCFSTYSFTASANGLIYIEMGADGDSQIDSYLEVFDSNGRRITRNNNARSGSADSRIVLRVRAGRTYYVRASTAGETEGDFGLTVTSRPYDDAGNDLENARRLYLSIYGSGATRRRINYGDDVDVFTIVATQSGQTKVDLNPYTTSGLDSTLVAAAADGSELASDDDGGAASVTFDVVAGETYYLTAGSLDSTTGLYRLSVTMTETLPPTPDPDPDPTPDPDPDPDPTPDPDPDPAPVDEPTPGPWIVGQVISQEGGLHLVVAGTNNADVITLSGDGQSISLVSTSCTQVFEGDFAYVTIFGFGGNDVIRTELSITATMAIYAGDGDDTVYENGQGGSVVRGGAGDDMLITLGGGRDIVRGETGRDSYWVDVADALADAAASEYSYKTVHRVSEFYQPWSTNPASVDYVSTDIDGQDLRDPVPNSYGRGWRNFADSPLFADGPEYDDVCQGAVGDCYYLASLASLCDSDPHVIQQMVTSLGDGTYAVRFYRGGQEVYLRLDADLPISSGTYLSYAKLSPDGETWVAIVEKAYAFFRYGQNSYDSISGGWMSTVYRELTDMSATTRWTGGSVANVADFIASSLNAGHAVTIGSYSGAPSPIVGSHAYMVKDIEITAAGTFVTIYNPWGVDGRGYDDDYYDGLLRITMEQFQLSFSAIVASEA